MSEVKVDYFLSGLSTKTIVLVRVYNQHFQGTILWMVFAWQEMYFLLKIVGFPSDSHILVGRECIREVVRWSFPVRKWPETPQI